MGAYALYFPIGSGLPHMRKGSACIPFGFIPMPDSPSYIRPRHSHEAASFALCYGLRLWPTPLTGFDPVPSGAFRGAVSGQVPPECYHSNAPSAYMPKRATHMATSFHVASLWGRDPVLASAPGQPRRGFRGVDPACPAIVLRTTADCRDRPLSDHAPCRLLPAAKQHAAGALIPGLRPGSRSCGLRPPQRRRMAALWKARAREEKNGVRAIARTSTSFHARPPPRRPCGVPTVPSSKTRKAHSVRRAHGSGQMSAREPCRHVAALRTIRPPTT